MGYFVSKEGKFWKSLEKWGLKCRNDSKNGQEKTSASFTKYLV